MREIVSCCGTVCSECPYYPGDCAGCSSIRGKVFWLSYTGEAICDIYDCCVNQRGADHCGECEELPCSRYERNDPTKTQEENEADHKRQLEKLASMRQSAGKAPRTDEEALGETDT